VLAVVTLVVAAATLTAIRSKPSGTTVGFWFEPISSETLTDVPERLGAISAGDLEVIESLAFAELAHAFRDFQVTVTARRDATYRVRVVDSLRNPLAPKMFPPSGESRSIPGLGGQGAVNFRLFAHSAVAYAPTAADRAAIIAGIGRGIGRAAVHEFAHQFLGSIDIHSKQDVSNYEYRSADRIEQYYGDMRWGRAGPLIAKRMGTNGTGH
jgi:hypothetical protein